MQHRMFGDPNVRQDAITFFQSTRPSTISFTGQNVLRFMVADPASTACFFGDDIAFNTAALRTLADGKPLVRNEIEKDGKMYVVYTGPGAITAARTIRDEAGVNFVGSANIPEGPTKSSP